MSFKGHISDTLKHIHFNQLNFTFTLAEDAGKVTRINISNAGGGINRSPFLTAPFTKIGCAFGVDKILPPYQSNTSDENGIGVKSLKLKHLC